MESSTFEQVVEDEDVVLELEAISIAEDADSSGSMAYRPRRDVGPRRERARRLPVRRGRGSGIGSKRGHGDILEEERVSLQRVSRPDGRRQAVEAAPAVTRKVAPASRDRVRRVPEVSETRACSFIAASIATRASARLGWRRFRNSWEESRADARAFRRSRQRHGHPSAKRACEESRTAGAVGRERAQRASRRRDVACFLLPIDVTVSFEVLHEPPVLEEQPL